MLLQKLLMGVMVLSQIYGPVVSCFLCSFQDVIHSIIKNSDPPFEGEAQDEILQKVEAGKLDFSAEEWSQVS
jgi:hypothetical protein